MTLKTLVKISSVNNLSDARYCAGMGVAALGFDLNPNSKGFISTEKFHEIAGWVSGVQFVGEFNGNIPVAEMQELLKHYQLNYIEFDNVNALATLAKVGVPLVFRLDIENYSLDEDISSMLGKLKGSVQYFFIDSSKEAVNEHAIDYLLKQSTEYDIFLGAGIDTKNVLDILENHPIKGIALKGGNEIRPGFGNFDDLADMLVLLEDDD